VKAPRLKALRLTPQAIAGCAFLVTVLALAAGFVTIDRSGEQAIARQQAANARSARDYFLAFEREEGQAALVAALNRRERSGSTDGFRYALTEADGRVVAGADVVGRLAAPDAGWSTVIQQDSSPRHSWRVLSAPVAGRRILVVAEDLAARDAFRGALLRGSLLALLFCVVAMLGLGLALNGLLYRRAQGIADAADRIAAGDLSARAPANADGEVDVFDHLGVAVNAMLGRIEALMTGMRTVTDSMAHDLRSPLTRMRAYLAQALDPAEGEAARLDAIACAHEEADRALATLSALLDIANAESGLSRDLMTHIDVGRLAAEMGDLFTPVIEDAGQALVIDVPPEPVIALAHELLLRQALGNLLHNAAVHAGDGAAVALTVARAADRRVRLTVQDDGPGVPEAQLGLIPERFVRLDAARSKPGSGLGLSIAAACARLHGGRLALEDAGPGLRAVIELEGR
jgi:hypothetical protein